jgi:hypothetical protein
VNLSADSAEALAETWTRVESALRFEFQDV